MKLNKQLPLLTLIVGMLSSSLAIGMNSEALAFLITRGKAPIKPIQAYMINDNHNLLFAIHNDSITFWDTLGNQLHEIAKDGDSHSATERVLKLLAHNLRSPEQANRIFLPTPLSEENICPICLKNETEFKDVLEHGQTPCCHKFICRDDLATVKALGQACPLCRSRTGWE